jgi:O-antigen/teichoic acid export membrane protein
VPVKPRWAKIEYRELLKQSLPQVGVVLITSALARFDWLFIGFILSAAKLAEYSFAYKIFEISNLPLLAIAPLLMPRFTKLFKSDDHREADLKLLIRIELVIAAFTALLVNMCWNPIIDIVTGGKYGAVNTTTIFILSLCIPFMYLSNFLWTIFFVQNRLKMILHSFLITFGVNVVGDLLLIPIYKNEGAATAFLLACLAQVVFYLTKNTLSGLRGVFYSLILSLACAALSGILAKMLFQNSWLALLSSMLFFVLLLLATRQIKLCDGKQLLKLLNW